MAKLDIPTLRALAQRAGLSTSTVVQAARGAIPGPRARAAIASALGVTESDLWVADAPRSSEAA
jgi:lambda repressor-like predicted transcriptional regulator